MNLMSYVGQRSRTDDPASILSGYLWSDEIGIANKNVLGLLRPWRLQGRAGGLRSPIGSLLPEPSPLVPVGR